MKYSIYRNEEEITDGSWEVGDKFRAKLELEDGKYRSKIELIDTQNQIRFASIKGGKINELKTIIPSTLKSGTWRIRLTIIDVETQEIQIHIKGNKELQKDKREKSKIGSNNHTELEAQKKAEEEEQLRLKQEDEARIKAEREAQKKAEEEEQLRLKQEDEARIKAEREAQLKAEEEEQLRQKQEEEARIKAEQEAQLKAEEAERLRKEREINIKEMDKDELLIMISKMDSEEELDRIIAIELNDEEKADLEIPVSEIESIDKKYYVNLRENNVKYLYDMLEKKPIDIKQAADAPMDEIRAWYTDLYRIYDNDDHMLRKEYRKIRTFNAQKDQELAKIRDSPKAEDLLDVLSGVSSLAKEKLNEIGIYKVIDILEQPLDVLIHLEVDPERPLLWKLWLTNAKAHFQIH
ncbi:MAG: cell envelope integrity protein TolA [Candidatus Heimdallarchaeota archaeon]|nr:cell envelope integrity protein TolA [Candidatus Heimdallarchaeota archaeon]